MKLYFEEINVPWQPERYRYSAEQTLLTLFPEEKPEYPEGSPALLEGEEPFARFSLERGEQTARMEVQVRWEGRIREEAVEIRSRELDGPPEQVYHTVQHALKMAFYLAAVGLLGKEPPWGALTGVRPVKLPTKGMLEGKTEEEVRRDLREIYRVSPRRAALAARCARSSVETLKGLEARDLSLYIGIPFCPTRCAYCSFVSADVGRSLALLEPFLEGLERELGAVGRNLSRAEGRIRTLYMGGGTPTTLSAEQLDRLLCAAERELDLSACTEFTVEAGRPDTITREKMKVLAAHGICRVSVNPQTMEDEVLKAMGRAHRAEDIRRAYADVRASGTFDVNMDLIAGLPKDTAEGFRRTVEEILALRPENITVHTLALKKGSALKQERNGLLPPEEVAGMLDDAWDALAKAGYHPYYLYRQKYMSGGFENVGWCLPGRENRYNIIMMEELHTVLALGGGGMTKLIDRKRGKITRRNNPKYPKEYLERIDAVCQEKEDLIWPIS